MWDMATSIAGNQGRLAVGLAPVLISLPVGFKREGEYMVPDGNPFLAEVQAKRSADRQRPATEASGLFQAGDVTYRVQAEDLPGLADFASSSVESGTLEDIAEGITYTILKWEAVALRTQVKFTCRKLMA